MCELTILFMPESAYGPTNNCIGIGDLLRRRGHRVVFAAESSWRGKLGPLGFEEDLVDLAPPATDAVDPGQFWKDFVRETAPEFRKPTIEQLETWIKPVWEELISGARYCHGQLTEVVDRVHPDVIVEDNVVEFPALRTAGVPFVRIVSCNPLEVKDPGLPPAFSGYASTDSGDMYVYSEAADYARTRPLGAGWQRLDSSVRHTDSQFTVPPALAGRDGSLVYFSLGSLGSADVELMRRVLDCLAKTPHRHIVSMGPLHAELELADNMVGAEFLPQTSIIPMVDLVITHGGNNTTTECFHFGRPMIVLPLFWDQYDNAQRVDELGYGVRLDTYRFTDAELHAAVDRLVGDSQLRGRLAAAGAMIRARDGVGHAADAIERLGRAGQV
jgi:UDP:flavonoid glycosyltransferase YjiC (YdhE family)